MDWSKDGKTILYTRQDGYMKEDVVQLWIIDVATQEQRRIDKVNNPLCAKYAEDDKNIYFLQNNNTLQLYDAQTNTVSKTKIEFLCKTGVSGFTFAPNFKSIRVFIT